MTLPFCGKSKDCHPERSRRVFLEKRSAVQKILRLASLAQDDMVFRFTYRFFAQLH